MILNVYFIPFDVTVIDSKKEKRLLLPACNRVIQHIRKEQKIA
jgi:ribosomal 30S subunit maturation factor RimM